MDYDTTMNGDSGTHTADGIVTDDGGALATDRAEAREHLDTVQRDHASKLTELNKLTNAVRAKERVIETAKADLATLRVEHSIQSVRVAAAQRRLTGAERELETVMRDSVRSRTATPRKGRK